MRKESFHNNPTIDPKTGKSIKINSPRYKDLSEKYGVVKIKSPKSGYKITVGKGEYKKLLKDGYTEAQLLKIETKEIVLPEDMINIIIKDLDFKSYVEYCKTNKLINTTCQKTFTMKLEQEIEVPLTNYSKSQINKIAKMVLNGSFRQDLLLQNYVFNINEDGDLVKLTYGVPTIYKNNYVKLLESFHRLRNYQILLLDNQGKIWSYRYEDIWGDKEGKLTQLTKNITVVDIACHRGLRILFFAAIESDGTIFAAQSEDPLTTKIGYSDIGNVKGAVKIAVGESHIVVLDDQGDVYFFSQFYTHQIPLPFNYKDRVPFTKIPVSNIKQVVVYEYTTICLKHDGSMILFTPPSRQYEFKYNKHIIHMAINNKIFVVLDNNGNLYQIDFYSIQKVEDIDNYLIGEHVCDYAVGDIYDVMMIKADGMYSIGNSDWKGGFTTMAYKEPKLYKYNPL